MNIYVSPPRRNHIDLSKHTDRLKQKIIGATGKSFDSVLDDSATAVKIVQKQKQIDNDSPKKIETTKYQKVFDICSTTIIPIVSPISSTSSKLLEYKKKLQREFSNPTKISSIDSNSGTSSTKNRNNAEKKLFVPELSVPILSDVDWTPKAKISKKKQLKARKNKRVLVDVDTAKLVQREDTTEKNDSNRTGSDIYPVRENTKIRFYTDENNNIIETYAFDVPYDHYLTREDIVSNWYNRKELMEIKKDMNAICAKYIYYKSSYKDAVTRLLTRCGAQRTATIVYDADLDYVLNYQPNEFDVEDDVSTIVDGEARGLEKRIILSMSLPFHRHKRSIHAALDTQRRLKAIDAQYFTYDQRVRLIATQYSLNAAYAAKWAHMIGIGDEKSVARNFEFAL